MVTMKALKSRPIPGGSALQYPSAHTFTMKITYVDGPISFERNGCIVEVTGWGRLSKRKAMDDWLAEMGIDCLDYEPEGSVGRADFTSFIFNNEDDATLFMMMFAEERL